MRVTAEVAAPGVFAGDLAAVVQLHVPQLGGQGLLVVGTGEGGVVAVGVADAHFVLHLHGDNGAGGAVVFFQEGHQVLEGQRVALERGHAVRRERGQRCAVDAAGEAIGVRIELDVLGDVVRVTVLAGAEPEQNQVQPGGARAVDGVLDQRHVVDVLFGLDGVPVDGRFQRIAAVELHGADGLVQHVGAGGGVVGLQPRQKQRIAVYVLEESVHGIPSCV